MATNPVQAPPPTPEQTALLAVLRDVVARIRSVSLAAPREAERELEKAIPTHGPLLTRAQALAKKGVAAGWLVPRTASPTVRYGRFEKDLAGYSVDFVLMEGSAAGHTHIDGEINFGWAWSGKPHFDGHPPGWVVFPPGSHHIPIVTGGVMLLLYFLPGGRVAWDPPPTPKA